MSKTVLNVKNFLTNQSVGKTDIDFTSIMEVELNTLLLSQYLRTMKAAYHNVRTACTKPRSLVAGSRAKKQQQKGTGRARLSDKLAPHFRGGGTIFGPIGQISSVSVMKKQVKNIKRMLIAEALRTEKIIVVSDFNKIEINTKSACENVKKLCGLGKKDYPSCIMVSNEQSPENLMLSVANMPNVNCTTVKSLTVHNLIHYKSVIITNDALKNLINSLI